MFGLCKIFNTRRSTQNFCTQFSFEIKSKRSKPSDLVNRVYIKGSVKNEIS